MSASAQQDLPNIRLVITTLAGDCGFINRDDPDPVEPALAMLRSELKAEHLEQLEAKLHALGPERLQKACIGEERETFAAMNFDADLEGLIGMVYDALTGCDDEE